MDPHSLLQEEGALGTQEVGQASLCPVLASSSGQVQGTLLLSSGHGSWLQRITAPLHLLKTETPWRIKRKKEVCDLNGGNLSCRKAKDDQLTDGKAAGPEEANVEAGS